MKAKLTSSTNKTEFITKIYGYIYIVNILMLILYYDDTKII